MANKKQIEARLKQLRSRLTQKGLDAVLIEKRENYVYMSGFTGTSANLLITHDKAILITDFRYMEQACEEAPAFDIVQSLESLCVTLNELIVSNGIKNLGFEEDYISYRMYDKYKKFDIEELVPMNGMIEILRLVKNSDEIEAIKKSVAIADEAFSHVLGYIKPGVTEIEIAAELEYYFRRNGARGPSFDTIVASGVRSSLPHGVASNKVIEQGDAVTMDFGAIYNEYCSDMTRTVFVGQPSEELKKIYGIVLKAQLAGIEGARSGRTGREVDEVARNIIAEAGYGENFGHSLGHGVGLEVHEDPRLSLQNNLKLQNSMVVTIEPGIYVEGIGGVRIEDMIVIKDDNAIVLTSSTKDMLII